MRRRQEEGFVLISTLMVTALLLSFLGAYYLTMSHEIVSMRYSKNTTSGFYAAEAGLNIRAENIRSIFSGYNSPSGESPGATNVCADSNQGSGDYACVSYDINKRTVHTYVEPDESNPVILTVPPGELYQNLNAQEYRYVTKSFAKNSLDQLEANLELHFRTRLVPLFQFAAFYDKDLEILPGPTMTLAGPVHTNGDLYLNANTRLSIDGQVTVAGSMFRGRKNSNQCRSNPVEVRDPTNYVSVVPSCSARVQLQQSALDAWNGMIETGVLEVVVPSPELLDADPGNIYWDRADLRLVHVFDGSDTPSAIEVWDEDGNVEASHTAQLMACPGATDDGTAVGQDAMYNFRESKNIELMEVDLQALFNCLHNTNWFGTGKSLADTSDGGLVIHMTAKGPNSSSVNKYGVRLTNGEELQSNVAGAATVQGLTVVSDQALYVQGHYNSVNKIPAAAMADSLNVLSEAWDDANSADSNKSNRRAADTTINAAFLSGTDSTGGIEGTGGQGGYYNGGLENYPRFHENWSSRTLLYRGSFVSLGVARHVDGRWGDQSYSAPRRDWNYDVSFNNAANLPPLTPRFVYLKQELFVRDFNQVQ